MPTWPSALLPPIQTPQPPVLQHTPASVALQHTPVSVPLQNTPVSVPLQPTTVSAPTQPAPVSVAPTPPSNQPVLYDDSASQGSWYYDSETPSDQDDSEFSDHNNNSVVSVASYPSTSRPRKDDRTSLFKKRYMKLSAIYPLKFRNRESVLPYYNSMETGGSDSGAVPELIIKPPLSGSWLDPPDVYQPGDTVKFWKPSTTFPRGRSHFNPETFKLSAKAACHFNYFQDENLKNFLKAPPLKTQDLDHAVFDKGSVEVGSNPHSKIDSTLRLALTDSLVNDELLQILFDIAKSFSGELSRGTTAHKYESLLSTISMIAENNQRSGQAVLAACVTNKLALRDHVLKKYKVPKVTGGILRGSNFQSDKLFGPLPESFKEALLHPLGSKFKCLSRDGGSYSDKSSRQPPFKRSSSGSYPSAKRSKSGGPSSTSKAPFFRNKNRRRR